MEERIVVTGGAGCIGSDLAEKLVELGHEVTVVDNLSSGKLEHIEPMLGKANFRFLELDLLDLMRCMPRWLGRGWWYHLAANPDVKFVASEPTDKDLKQNTIATYHVLESMRRHGIRKLGFASTSAVYGISEVQPIPETQPMRPISLYGAHKLACEAMISRFSICFQWIAGFSGSLTWLVLKYGSADGR